MKIKDKKKNERSGRYSTSGFLLGWRSRHPAKTVTSLLTLPSVLWLFFIIDELLCPDHKLLSFKHFIFSHVINMIVTIIL